MNTLIAGSDGGARHWAIAASLIKSAKLSGLDPAAYLADVLDRIGNPNAITLTRVQNAADGDFGEWIRDRKNRRAIPHRMETRGYVPLRNPAAGDGLWKVRGRRQVIYAKSTMPLADQVRAAEALIESMGGCFGQ